MAAPPPDGYFKKEIALRLRSGASARFRVSQALFSSHLVDAGTGLLLRSLDGIALPPAAAILDLGCGYGPIGIALAMTHPDATVLAVDRDALAVDYARQNAALNDVDGRIEAAGGLGYDDLGDRRFDLIVMNIPGKAGERVIEHLLLGALAHLNRDGIVAIVAVAPLGSLVATTLASDRAIEITYQHRTDSYAVTHYRFDGGDSRGRLSYASAMSSGSWTPANAFDAGIYNRAVTAIDAGGRKLELQTVYGLSEFDMPSFTTQLLLQELAATIDGARDHISVINPNQGHAAALAHELSHPRRIKLVSRDLLSLRATRRNLIRNGAAASIIETHHTPAFPPELTPANIIVATIDDGDVIEAATLSLQHAAAALALDGTMLIAASSTTATRIAKRLADDAVLHVEERRRRRGGVVLSVRRR